VEPQRPDPDKLLKSIQEDEARQHRAKLKIFFGMAAGVGKTYAMLREAHHSKDDGLDVAIGIVETHGRPDTLRQVEGFDILPRKTLPYRGTFLEEFDLDAAIARKPQIILMDELAHSNVMGSRHQKRWQDVMELLDAGIDVYTTVNVQHLESYKDVVAQITGVVVRETIPDTIMQRADELELVDISPDELIQRLKEGKVYVPDQAKHAIDRFFRKGNLMALREMSLRRTAELVDADMRRYMETERIQKTWAVSERIMVCIDTKETSAKLIRAGHRMAEGLKAPWIAAYVETSRKLNYSEQRRERLEENLRLAERLGAETIVVQGDLNIADDLIALATSRNATRIIVGKPKKSRLKAYLTGSILDELIRKSGDIDVHVITGDAEEVETDKSKTQANRQTHAPAGTPAHGQATGMLSLYYVYASFVVALITGIGFLLSGRLRETDMLMVYLLGILVVATRVGRWPSLYAAALSAIAYDFFFAVPKFTLSFTGLKHLGTGAVMVAVGAIIGNLTERIRRQARLARIREQRTLALFRLTNELTRNADSASMVEAAVHSVENQFQSKAAIFLPDAHGRIKTKPGQMPEGFTTEELGVAQWAQDHQEPAGFGTDTLPGAKALYLPLRGTQEIIGVMGLRPDGVPHWMEPDQRHLLEAFANQAALALERVILAEKSNRIQLDVEREQLRNTLLSAVSHDLRTPLGAITGAATTLLGDHGQLTGNARKELLETIHEDASQLQRLVSNLLEVTRLESGVLEVRKEWVPVEELVGSALDRLRSLLGERSVKVELPTNLPLVPVDSVLMEQVLINVMENAAKYSPEDKPIEIKGWATDKTVTLAVTDAGPGIPEGEEEHIFEKLVRLPNGKSRPGAGLGLAICKGIMEAHGGWINAGNRPSGGAQFLMSLPLEGQPPAPPAEEAADA
jgi:two-component system, OmpR family, sensor histidine kinase KdpD